MAKTPERKLGLAVMQVLASRPNHLATVSVLIKRVPDYITLTDEDRLPSQKRPGEEMWEQRVRNLKSHSKSEGNVIAEGYVRHVKRATYQLTESGLVHLENKGML